MRQGEACHDGPVSCGAKQVGTAVKMKPGPSPRLTSTTVPPLVPTGQTCLSPIMRVSQEELRLPQASLFKLNAPKFLL